MEERGRNEGGGRGEGEGGRGEEPWPPRIILLLVYVYNVVYKLVCIIWPQKLYLIISSIWYIYILYVRRGLLLAHHCLPIHKRAPRGRTEQKHATNICNT
jgi:hypothetical protein